jgi:hypothetical protein
LIGFKPTKLPSFEPLVENEIHVLQNCSTYEDIGATNSAPAKASLAENLAALLAVSDINLIL